MDFSTIAAISTPRGKGGVALLRISGTRAFEISERIFRPFDRKKVLEHSARYQIYGNILSADGKTVLDDGLLTYFASPASFTGEDVVEIACHGGEIISAMILSAILESGAVLAGPGEFSRRAFMNGKLSLTAAEGVADLLDAKTEESAILSSKTVRGNLSKAIGELSDKVLAVSSSLWAYLDYPEEDLQSMSDEEMVSLLSEIGSDCSKLLDSYKIGRAVNEGVSAAIVGKPNVGKSTFFNLLLGEDRAIVTAIPGTTRDVIEYPLKAGKVLINLSDTAGVRNNAADQVEEIGIQKAISTIEESELIFAVFDLSRNIEEDDQIVIDALKKCEDAVVIPILTKGDLEEKLEINELPFERKECFFFDPDHKDLIPLIEKIESAFISDQVALREGRVLTNARQKSRLVRGMDLILEAKEQILDGQKDVASLTLEEALSSFLEIDGKTAGEKILDEVFSRFCIGK